MTENKRKYELIALDMDGTVLNDEKKIDSVTKEAINSALSQGKHVVFCSGRSYAEMKDVTDMFPMTYLCGESGALIYNLKEKCQARAMKMEPETVRQLIDLCNDRDVMFMAVSCGYDHCQKDQLENLAHYEMDTYTELFTRTSTPEYDIISFMEENISDLERLLIFHTCPEERDITLAQIKELGVNITTAYSEISALECSPMGVHKGKGLEMLCEEVGISMNQTIMVGDSFNDMPAIKAAGLGIAIGNAIDEVKDAADVVVADNNHNGCAEAIYKYL